MNISYALIHVPAGMYSTVPLSIYYLENLGVGNHMMVKLLERFLSPNVLRTGT
uniref:Uncharacterized protein n=1 Tax=Arundo donax TaxID=35708 RepID=A0A0A8Y3E2_ARUDO